MDTLLAVLGVSTAQTAEVHALLGRLTPGTAATVPWRLPCETLTLSLHCRCDAIDGRPHMFLTLSDISPFVQEETRTRARAAHLLTALRAPLPEMAGRSGRDVARGLMEDLIPLMAAADDESARASATRLAAAVDALARQAVAALQAPNPEEDPPRRSGVTAPDLLPLRHYRGPDGDWEALQALAAVAMEHPDRDLGAAGACLRNADRFARAAPQILLLSPTPGRVLVLNGPHNDAVVDSEAALVRHLGVAEDNRFTATAFFESLRHAPAEATFCLGGQRMEARGRPVLLDGWQSLLAPALTEAVDTRGLFHAFKNRLLNMQVLHVIATRATAQELGPRLLDTATAIQDQLADLERLAATGRRRTARRRPAVSEWLAAVRTVAAAHGLSLTVEAPPAVARLRPARGPVADMPDTLAELALNAVHHGASSLTLTAHLVRDRLVITLTDDGHGMSPAQLARVRAALESENRVPGLSTRTDGSGTGLQAAAAVLRRFPHGSLGLGPGPGDHGVRVVLSLQP